MSIWESESGGGANAIHTDKPDEIAQVELKATPAGADYILVEDFEDSNNKKRITVGTLPTGTGGEANTASNQGTDGVGVYDAKAGIDLQFRNIAPASNKITTTLNSKDIDIDIVPTNITEVGTLTALDVTGNITVGGNVDGVDVAALETDVDEFPDELKNLTTAEIQQVENIGTTTISSTQWGYLGGSDQATKTTDNVTFNNITTTGTVDGKDIAAHVDAANPHSGSAASGANDDITSITGMTTMLALSQGGTGANLADPDADRLWFWDDSAGAVDWLVIGTNLSITDKTLNATGGAGGSPLTTKGDLYTYTTVDARLPIGADGQVLTADSGEASGIKWSAVAGTGDVVKVGAPVDSQLGIWTGDGTIEGDSALTFDTSTDTLSIGASGKLNFGAVNVLTDTTGTTTLANIDAVDATTIATIESATDAFAEPFSGIDDPDQLAITYNATNRQFTVVNSGAKISVNGVISTPQDETTTAHADTTAQYWAYYASGATTLTVSTTADISEAAIAGRVYYNTDQGVAKAIIFEERHSQQFSAKLHESMHQTVGAKLVTSPLGCVMADYTLQSSVDADMQFSMSAGEMYDEDIEHVVTALATGGYTISYRAGADVSNRLDWDDTATLPFLYGASYIYYNQNNAGTWQLTEMDTNDYVNYYAFAWTRTDNTRDIVVFMGQASHETLALAQAEEAGDLEIPSHFAPEQVPLYRITFRTRGTYGSTGQCRIEDILDYRGTVSGAQVVSGSTVDHQSLTNRDVDGHPNNAYLLGREGGQTFIGGTESGDDLIFQTTSDTTKGSYVFSELTTANGVMTTDGSGVVTSTLTPSGLTTLSTDSLTVDGNNVGDHMDAANPHSGSAASGANTDITSITGMTTMLALNQGGTGANLTDPGVDRLWFWDDSAGAVDWLILGTNLSITDKTLNAAAGSGGYAEVQEEGSALTARTKINFVGSAATATDDAGNTRTNVTFNSDLNEIASENWTGAASITTTGALNSGAITSGFGNIDVGASSIDGGTITADTNFAGNLTGNITGNCSGTAATVTGAAQTNITSVGTLTGLTLSGTMNLQDNIVQRPKLKDYSETLVAGGTGGSYTFDLESGNVFSRTVNAAATFTFSNPIATGSSSSFTVYLTNGGSATITWPTSLDWAGGTAPDLTSAGIDILVFSTIDGGTTWHGAVGITDSK